MVHLIEIFLSFFKGRACLNDPNYTNFSSDFSEFDTAQEERGIWASIIVLKALGFNDKMMDFYYHMRSHWTLYERGTDANKLPTTARLDGVWMQHSGQPFTLDGNTMFNMSSIGACYDFKDLQFAAFKGDDCFCNARSITENRINSDSLRALFGFKIKVDNKPIAEYIANIITPSGDFFPDVIRRCSRVLSKIYTNKTDWEEVRISLADSLDVIDSDSDLTYGCTIASLFYQQYNLSISEDNVRTMLDFLYQLTKLKSIDDIPQNVFKILYLIPN
jgi:hypothetical protein